MASYADDKINCSLSDKDRGFLRQLAGIAKENDLLDGKGRKTLFEGGKYVEWYPSRFQIIVELLTDIQPDVEEDIKVVKSKLELIELTIKELEYYGVSISLNTISTDFLKK